MKEKPDNPLRIVYAGDRDVSVWVLKFLIKQSVSPLALMVSDEKRASHDKKLIALLPNLPNSRILRGTDFRKEAGIKLLKVLEIDYIICVHFPYIFPRKFLNIPEYGVLNLHPAYLPYNRGWHTSSWAIWEGTPYGATLHFMSDAPDSGDIVLRRELKILPGDTADSLYKRTKRLELKVFKEAWYSIVSGTYERKPQVPEEGTSHKKEAIFSIQPINLEAKVVAGELIRRLKALSTNKIEEAAFFEENGRKYRLQLRIKGEDGS